VNDTDFRAQLTTIKATTPEWLGVYAANTEGSKIINQMYELGLLGKVNIFSGYGVLQDLLGPGQWPDQRSRQLGRRVQRSPDTAFEHIPHPSSRPICLASTH
jgi:hypothetical protein